MHCCSFVLLSVGGAASIAASLDQLALQSLVSTLHKRAVRKLRGSGGYSSKGEAMRHRRSAHISVATDSQQPRQCCVRVACPHVFPAPILTARVTGNCGMGLVICSRMMVTTVVASCSRHSTSSSSWI